MKLLKRIEAACAPVALCYVSGIDEETVIRVCAMHGFEAGEGMTDDEYLEAATDLGLECIRVRNAKDMRLGAFVRKHATGLYLVATHDHLFAVDNGIVADCRNPDRPGLGRIVKAAWRVEK